jgi:hypothetical protein
MRQERTTFTDWARIATPPGKVARTSCLSKAIVLCALGRDGWSANLEDHGLIALGPDDIGLRHTGEASAEMPGAVVFASRLAASRAWDK